MEEGQESESESESEKDEGDSSELFDFEVIINEDDDENLEAIQFPEDAMDDSSDEASDGMDIDQQGTFSDMDVDGGDQVDKGKEDEDWLEMDEDQVEDKVQDHMDDHDRMEGDHGEYEQMEQEQEQKEQEQERKKAQNQQRERARQAVSGPYHNAIRRMIDSSSASSSAPRQPNHQLQRSGRARFS